MGLCRVNRLLYATTTLTFLSSNSTVTSSLFRISLKNHDQTHFSGLIGVGSPPQRFQVIFDTGSSDIWFPEINCTNCAGSRRYHAAASRSHVAMNQSFHLEYGSGNASGCIVRDDISMFSDNQNLTLSNLRLGSTSKITKRLQHIQADGIVGLGFGALALITKPTLIQNDPRFRRFSIYINPRPNVLPSSQLIFGGVDDLLPIAHISDKNGTFVNWHHFPLVGHPFNQLRLGFWAIRLDRIVVSSPLELSLKPAQSDRDGVVVVTAAIAIVDSGTSQLLLPRTAFAATITKIQQHLRLEYDRELRMNLQTTSGYTCEDCKAEMFPTIQFTFVREMTRAALKHKKTQTLMLQGTDYVRCDDFICAPQLNVHTFSTLKKNKRKMTDANGSLVTITAQQDEIVVLGLIFMRAYYVQFDSERKTVGFACIDSAPFSLEHGVNFCAGGWTPKLHFRSTRFMNAKSFKWQTVFWLRVLTAIVVLLLAMIFMLLWLIVEPSSDLEKVLIWLSRLASACQNTSQKLETENDFLLTKALDEPDLEPETLYAAALVNVSGQENV
ncbi:putative aspartic peptidase A1 family, aspartic peptidase domain superfamily [Plasmopara halstedii]